MKHPTTRGYRRYAREIWRNHRRTTIFTLWSGYSIHDAMRNGGWLKGGKQYFACGNRCFDAMYRRIEANREAKKIRRMPIEHPDEE